MTKYDELVKDFHEFESDDPIACTWSGIEGKDHLLSDPSLEKTDTMVRQAKELLNRVEHFPSEEVLNADQKLDLDLMKLSLEYFIHVCTLRFNGLLWEEQNPDAGDELGSAINPLFVRDPREPEVRLDFILARLKLAPGFLHGTLGRLKKPVKRWVQIELDACSGLPELFENVCDWAKKEEYAKLEELIAAKDEAVNALNEYVDKLKVIETTDNFVLAEEDAREIVRLRGIPLSFEQLHQIAKDFFAENTKVLEELREKLVSKYSLAADASLEEVGEVIKKKHEMKEEEIIPRYHSEQERVKEFIHKTGLFEIPRDQSLIIEKTPNFLIPTIPIGAMFTPAAFSKGTKTSVVYLTITPGRVSDQNALSITNTIIHEGIPGHHLHFATALSNPSVVRKHIGNNDQAEGWTTTMEDYMIEVGFVDADMADEARFLSRRELARMGARVAIDLFFMTGKDSYLDVGLGIDVGNGDAFEKAGALLTAVTGFTPDRAQGELNWYSQARGYPLSYLTGNRLVAKLKKDMKAHVGDKYHGAEFDKLFHKTYLEAGCMPVAYMWRVFKEKGLVGSGLKFD